MKKEPKVNKQILESAVDASIQEGPLGNIVSTVKGIGAGIKGSFQWKIAAYHIEQAASQMNQFTDKVGKLWDLHKNKAQKSATKMASSKNPSIKALGDEITTAIESEGNEVATLSHMVKNMIPQVVGNLRHNALSAQSGPQQQSTQRQQQSPGTEPFMSKKPASGPGLQKALPPNKPQPQNKLGALPPVKVPLPNKRVNTPQTPIAAGGGQPQQPIQQQTPVQPQVQKPQVQPQQKMVQKKISLPPEMPEKQKEPEGTVKTSAPEKEKPQPEKKKSDAKERILKLMDKHPLKHDKTLKQRNQEKLQKIMDKYPVKSDKKAKEEPKNSDNVEKTVAPVKKPTARRKK